MGDIMQNDTTPHKTVSRRFALLTEAELCELNRCMTYMYCRSILMNRKDFDRQEIRKRLQGEITEELGEIYERGNTSRY